MRLVRKLTNFWLMLLGFIGVAYFSIFNMDRITVNIPHFAQVMVPAAQIYLVIFFIGAAFASIHFAMDSIKKGWEIRRKNKVIRDLESRLREKATATSGITPLQKETKNE